MQSGQVTSAQAAVPDDEVAAVRASRSDAVARLWTQYRPRVFRTAVGLALLLWTADVVRRHVVMAVSLEAVVTTDIIDVTAPIEGIARRAVLEPGRLLDSGAPLVTIENPLVDASAHTETKAKVAALAGDVQSIEWLVAQLEKLNQTLAYRGAKFQTQRARQLQLLTEELEANVSANQAKLREAATRLDRAQTMTREGVATVQALQEAERDHTVAQQNESASARQLDNARATLDGLKDGLSLSDFSTADKSYSGQRQDEVTVALTRLRAEASAKRALLEALSAQLTSQVAQYEKHSAAALVTQQRSRVISIDVGEGAYVPRGAKLVKLADCSRLRVVAYVNERSYNRLRVGDSATVQVGLDNASYAGRVELLLGPPEMRVNAQAAAQMSSDLRGRYAVLVESTVLAREQGIPCNAGQSAKVTFSPSRHFWG